VANGVNPCLNAPLTRLPDTQVVAQLRDGVVDGVSDVVPVGHLSVRSLPGVLGSESGCTAGPIEEEPMVFVGDNWAEDLPLVIAAVRTSGACSPGAQPPPVSIGLKYVMKSSTSAAALAFRGTSGG
jgi:hypothetical protein